MARKGLRLELRTAIHRAIKGNETVIRQDVVVDGDGESQRINLVVRPLLELRAENVLVTHGQPVLGGGTQALRDALDARPWYHHG